MENENEYMDMNNPEDYKKVKRMTIGILIGTSIIMIFVYSYILGLIWGK